jgi:hypothetical protein
LNNKARYSLTQVSGARRTIFNRNISTYISSNNISTPPAPAVKEFTVVPYSHDVNNRNVVLELTINGFRGTAGSETDPKVGLDSSVINDLAKFNASFRIVHSPTAIPDISTLWGKNDLTFIDITKVEGIANPVAPGSTTTAIDTLRITLDKNASYNVGREWVGGEWVDGYTEHHDVLVPDTYKYTLATNLWQDAVPPDEGDPDDPDDNVPGTPGSFIGTPDTYYYSDGTGGYNSVYFNQYTTEFDADTNPTGYDSTETYYTQEVDVPGYTDHSGDVTISGYYEDGYYQATQIGSNYYYLLINTDFGYTGGKYLYGDPNNVQYDNFALYDLN